MKIWVDDIRPAPEGWRWAKSFNEAITFLRMSPKGKVTDVSLDHDLGFQEIDTSDWPDGVLYHPSTKENYNWATKTGYDIVRWMIDNDRWPSDSVAIHSANIVGAKNMAASIERYGPYVYREDYKVESSGYISYGVKYTKEGDKDAS